MSTLIACTIDVGGPCYECYLDVRERLLAEKQSANTGRDHKALRCFLTCG